MNITYFEIYRNCNNIDYLVNKRLEIVRYAYTFGIKPASRYFKCSKNTVKRWCKRYAVYGVKGLKNLSSRPHRIYSISRDDSEKIKKVVLEAKNKKKYITVKNIRKKTSIQQYSDVTLNRYINKALNKKKRNKIHSKANGKSIEFKKKLKPFDLIQVDIKDLSDIDNLKPYFYNRNLPRYEITARDVASGFSIVSYCSEKTPFFTTKFINEVLYPFLLNIPGLDLKKVTIQTDNGTEFTNNRIKTVGKAPKQSIFTSQVLKYFKTHHTNIPGHCTADSEVESFHWSIERDCLAWEDIINDQTLLHYVNNYIFEYNHTLIKNRGYSPFEKINSYFQFQDIFIPKVKILSI